MIPALVINTLTNPWGIFMLLLIGAICGLFVHAAAPQADAGLLGVIVRGFAGALAGVWIAAGLHLPALLRFHLNGLNFPVGWALLGGIIFMMLFRILRV